MTQTIISTGSLVLTLTGLAFGYYQWRKSQLRRDDVLSWANEVITALQSMLLICTLGKDKLDEEVAKAKISDLIFDTSILIEKGRLFFKNEVVDEFGAKKYPAYRGYRPEILDPIVVAYQIACEWRSADEEGRLRMRVLSGESLKKFVSLAQKEVGRNRTISAEGRRKGDGLHLRHLLNGVAESKLEKLRVRKQQIGSIDGAELG